LLKATFQEINHVNNQKPPTGGFCFCGVLAENRSFSAVVLRGIILDIRSFSGDTLVCLRKSIEVSPKRPRNCQQPRSHCDLFESARKQRKGGGDRSRRDLCGRACTPAVAFLIVNPATLWFAFGIAPKFPQSVPTHSGCCVYASSKSGDRQSQNPLCLSPFFAALAHFYVSCVNYL